MKQLHLLASLLFISILACQNPVTNEQQKGITNDTASARIPQPGDTTIDMVVSLIRKLPQVKKLEADVEKDSKNQRHISYMVLFDDSLKTRYNVRVGEDNGASVVNYYTFIVERNTLKVLNPDGQSQ